MKKMLKLLAIFLSLFLFLFLMAGCEKDTNQEQPVSAEPTMISTFVIKTTDTKSLNVSVTVSWTTQNVVKGTVDGDNLKTPSGDTTFLMKKGETKILAFVIENTAGVKIQKYLTVAVPSDPLPPTISALFTYNGVAMDTLPYLGGDIKIKVIFSNGILELNGVKYENSPTTFDFTVNETKTYDFKVVGTGGDITLSFPVPVYVPTEWELLITNPKGWICEYAEGSYSIDGVRIPQPTNFVGTGYFYLVPQKVTRYVYPCTSGNGTCFNEGPWSINGQILNTGSDNFIEVLTQTEMVWREKGIAMFGDTVVDYYTWRHLVHPN